MPNVPPPPISARMTATGGKHRPEKPLRKLPQLAKSSREDQPCRSLRKLPVNQSHESPSPLHKSIRKFVHAPLYASTDTGRQKIGARNRKVWKRVNVSNNPLDSKEFLERLRREWADSCNALLPGYAVIDHRSFKARGIERIPTIHEGYASREMEKRGGRGDLCEENRRIQALNRLLDALRAMIGRLSDQAQGILTAVKRRQRPSGAPQAPSSPEPAERPQERPQARETPPQAPQEPPKPIRTKKALTDRFKTRLDERLAENERKQAEKQAEPDMEETWDLSDPADPLNIGMGWGTGGHGLGL